METKKNTNKKCPLTQSEWINYLDSELNHIRQFFYSEELRFFTSVIILLTILFISVTILTFGAENFATGENSKKIILFLMIAQFIAYGIYYFYYFNKKAWIHFLNITSWILYLSFLSTMSSLTSFSKERVTCEPAIRSTACRALA